MGTNLYLSGSHTPATSRSNDDRRAPSPTWIRTWSHGHVQGPQPPSAFERRRHEERRHVRANRHGALAPVHARDQRGDPNPFPMVALGASSHYGRKHQNCRPTARPRPHTIDSRSTWNQGSSSPLRVHTPCPRTSVATRATISDR